MDKKRKLTPPQVAAMWGISADKIIRWILAGELRAIDASTRQGGRPRYLIDVDDLAAFERRRAVLLQPSPTAARRRKRENIPQYV